MRILILSQYWYPENGVPQRRWNWLTKILVDSGHEVTVIAPPPTYGIDQEKARSLSNAKLMLTKGPNGERIIRTPSLFGGHSIARRALAQAVAASGTVMAILQHYHLRSRSGTDTFPDLIIGTVPALPTATATLVASKLLRKPFIIDLRDAWPDLLEHSAEWNNEVRGRSFRDKVLSSGPLQVATFITRRSILEALKNASAVLVTADTLKTDLIQRRYTPLLPSATSGTDSNVVTIRNVFPPETKINFSLRNVSSKTEPLHVLYAGTLGRAQELTNALEAVEMANADREVVHLRMVGTGAAAARLIQIAEKRNLAVEFFPKTNADMLREHYEWADSALVHLADWSPLERAVPSKTYELMSTGIHISAAVAGESADIIQSTGAGHVVPPRDPTALANLWKTLQQDRSLLIPSSNAMSWVQKERDLVAPDRITRLVSTFPTQ